MQKDASASSSTVSTVFAWRNALLDEGRSAKTVGEVYLAAARSFFNWAVENNLTDVNPAASIKVRVKKKATTNRTTPGFEDAEANAILSEALRPAAGKETGRFTAAKRWVPWLCAYSGARVNEVTQLRRADVFARTIDGEEVWVMRITPEAGTVKTGAARDVPLHPHLVEQGFFDWVAGRPDGPLFYDPDLRAAARERTRSTSRSAPSWPNGCATGSSATTRSSRTTRGDTASTRRPAACAWTPRFGTRSRATRAGPRGRPVSPSSSNRLAADFDPIPP